MRHIFSGGMVAAALGATLMVAGAFPASAQVARMQPAFAAGNDSGAGLLTLVQNRDRGGGGNARGGGGGGGREARGGAGRGGNVGVRARGGQRDYVSRGARFNQNQAATSRRWVNNGNRNWRNGNRNWRNPYYRNRYYSNRYYYRNRGYGYWGSGVGVGLALSAPYYAYRPAYAVGDDAVAYCMSRFRSYDPASGTYLGYDGLRHACP